MSSDELIGQSLGQYQIRVLLGQGGMSSVYLAFQPSMERTVAIKVLPREFMHDRTFLTRFQQEARTIAKLEHLHILPVYDVGEAEGIPYLVMRYLPGGSFADMIDERLPPVATTVRLLAQIADALDYAHEHGIIHRDLKPSNILLDNSNNAYLADFGIARVAEAASMTGSRVLGTPPYIAPEMMRKDEKPTASVDIYALGIIAFEAMTGRPPFYDEDPMKTLMMHVLEPVPSARAVDPNIRPEIDEVLMKCLAKTPAERYRTAGDFASALARAASGVSPSQPTTRPRAAIPTDSTPAGMRPGDPPRAGGSALAGRTGLIAFAATIAIVGGLLLFGFAVTGGQMLASLIGVAPQPTTTLTPTVTLTPGGPQQTEPAAGGTLAPTVLPPPGGGDRLVFASERDGNLELYLMDIDGTNFLRLTHNVAQDFNPAWSPDGTKIAYASNTAGNAEIKVINLATCISQSASCDSYAQQITENTATDLSPDWSPDGQWIAFSSNRDGQNFDLFVMHPDGSDVRKLTNGGGDASSPRWSPDGKLIAYNLQQASSSDLYVVSLDGSSPQQLTSGAGLDLWPDWSPDGSKLVFSSTKAQPGGKLALFTIDLNTRSLSRLTDGQANDDDPAWSPDGTRIAFDSDRAGAQHFNLYILSLATGGITRLTETPQNDVAPAWQPRVSN